MFSETECVLVKVSETQTGPEELNFLVCSGHAMNNMTAMKWSKEGAFSCPAPAASVT